MVKWAQPYRAGDNAWRHPLAVLAELSNADKHRLLNPTFGFLRSDTKEVLDRLVGSYMGNGPSPVKSWWMLGQGSRLEHGTAWLRVAFDRTVLTEPPLKVEVGGGLSYGIAFGEIGMEADSYRHIGEAVWRVIERFLRQFSETRYID